ncbi:AAA family ATPase [Halanaerocella petrolearia]
MSNKHKKRKGQNFPNCYMLGVLHYNKKTYPKTVIRKAPVTIRNKKNVIFYVKNLSPSPENITECSEESFIGYPDLSLKKVGIPFDYQATDDRYEQEKIIKKELQNKLILFLPKLRAENRKGRSIYHKNFDIIDLDDFTGFREYETIEDLQTAFFRPIPGVSMSIDNFEGKLQKGTTIKYPEYDTSEMPASDIAICQNRLYLHLSDSNQAVKSIKLPDDFNEHVVYKYNDDLIFIDDEYYQHLKQRRGRELGTKSQGNRVGDLLTADELDKISKIETKEKKSKEESPSTSDTTKDIETENVEGKEEEFLTDLYQNALAKNLYYRKEDLYNLHTSIKTSPLTIISGMSGTGKTKLAQIYAETLGLELEDDYTIIPISPSYTEPNDLLGYLNTIDNTYTPAETGLVDILVKAAQNKDQLHMVIFDEMNLSQVEYWFSPFISLLELEEEDRKIKLYNENTLDNDIIEDLKYPSRLDIGNNIIFVGTVNIDETTKDFSDRLLDRANVITLDKFSFYEIKENLEKEGQQLEMSTADKVYNSIQFSQWQSQLDTPLQVLTDEELKLLDKIHNILNKVDVQKGVSFRVVENIAKYLENLPEKQELISRQDAFDLQLRQRILTKVRGPRQQYKELIGHLSEKGTTGNLYEILSSKLGGEVSHFKESVAELKRKAKEMELNGYAT